MKKFIRNNVKAITTFIIGMLLSGGVVYAAVAASVVTYSNSRSGLKDSNGNNVTNVQDAIDSLYSSASFQNNLMKYKTVGDAVTLGGYKWHVIGQDDTKIWLLMDAFDGNGTADINRQIPNMNHCRTGSSSNCTWNGSYYVYSWENSLIRTYLNDTFYNNLSADIKSKIIEQQVCKDPSLNSGGSWAYGGFIKEEIDELKKSYSDINCNSGYVKDNVRLISPSEYYNLSQLYSVSESDYPTTAPGGNGRGKIPFLNYIGKVSANNWLYSSAIGIWWTMGDHSDSNGVVVSRVQRVNGSGGLDADGNDLGERSYSVRPVIVLQK